MKKQLILLLCCCWMLSLQAQDALNMSLLSTWDGNAISTAGVFYNDIWGYVDDCENEYAIIGSPTKVHFIDVTNPAIPVFKGEFAGGATTIWRDMKTYDRYTYAVADQGSEGLMIFDMSALPDGPITKVYQENNVFTRAHNIYVDAPNARLYVVGANSNLIVYSLADPANPTVIANRGLPGGYVHDIFVKDNIAYCSHGYNGLYVYDCTNPANPILKANIDTGAYNHSSWLTEDGAYLIYAEEVPDGRPLGLIDMADVATNDLNITSTFSFPLLAPNHTDVTYHNPYIVDNYAIVSSYWDGVVIIDLSNPANPQKVAHYDTTPNNTTYPALDGCWGVYPYFPSGNIIASDTFEGLFVLSTTIALTSECSDGAQSPFESGSDCGGFCKPCAATCGGATCDDGIMNGDEIGIDCGGANCVACIAGCMDQNAHNFNANAQVDDGSCETCTDGILNGDEMAIDCGGAKCVACIAGCMDQNAHNFNANAQVDDGSCETCTDGILNGDEVAIDCGGTKCVACIAGCMDQNAHNYNANAQVDDGSCETCTDGVLNGDETEIDCGGAKCTACDVGCTDPNAHNYDPNAVVDNGTCETCNDGVMNGDELAIDCGGTKCIACIEGCTDPTAHNYDPAAQLSDNSCITCSDGILNGDEVAIDCGGTKCTPCIEGCTDPNAHNYNPEAQISTNTCETCEDGILNGDEVIVDCGGSKCTPCEEGCTNPDAHNYDPNAVVDNGTCETCNDGVMNGDEIAIDCGGSKCATCIEGCTNPAAHNYDASAQVDNGSCITCADGILNGDETAIDCGGTKCLSCDDSCDTYDFTNAIVTYDTDEGSAEVLDGGATAYIYNNAWKAVPLNYTVTANTVIEFDFKSEVEGEVHGLGFDTDLTYGPQHFLVFYGFQGYNGSFPTPDYSGSGNYEHFTIKIGDTFTGLYQYLVLICDNDQGAFGDSYFKNFQIYEDYNNNLICDDAPTCEDGIQNGEETGIDCGGPDCPGCLCTNVDVFIQFDQYPQENIWAIQDANGGILLNGSGQNRPEYSTYSQGVCLAGGCYTFTIEDEFGDGICCEYGQGYFTVTDAQSGTVLGNGAAFGNTAVVNFCITEGCTNPNAHNYDPDAQVTDNSCETCDDGILNGDEVVVDCGGAKCTPCIQGCMDPDAHNYNPAAQVPGATCMTCDDGIMNGDETAIDCGGNKCAACEESCPPILDLSGTITSGTIMDREVSDYISSKEVIMTGADISYSAKNYIELLAGFEVQSGAEFDVFLQGCTPAAAAANGVFIIMNASEENALIKYSVEEKGALSLSIYNHTGVQVLTLVEDEIVETGDYELNFSTNSLQHGLFYIKMKIAGKEVTRKLIILD